MFKTQDKVLKNVTMAYIPQESFLLNETFKKNIIFGKEEDIVFFRRVIDWKRIKRDWRERRKFIWRPKIKGWNSNSCLC